MPYRISYPNEGLYKDGQPRLELINSAGNITYSKLATAEQEFLYGIMTEISVQGEHIRMILKNQQ